MLTRELHYLSGRLVTDLVDQMKPRRHLKVRGGVSASVLPASIGASVEVEATGGDTTNRHALAAAAFKAAADEAGSVDHPGRYLHMRVAPIRLWVFSFKGYKRHPIALVSIDLGPTIVVLAGSAGNVSGYTSERHIDGWLPSDPIGLHQLVQFGADADLDPPMHKLLAERAQGAEAERLFFGDRPYDLATDAAFLGASILRSPDLETYAEVLAKVHVVRDDVTATLTSLQRRRRFDRVIVGAPVVLREPAAQPLPRL